MLNKLMGMLALKDVERLLLQQDLFVLREILWKLCGVCVFHASHFVGERLGHEFRSGRSLDTMRRERFELGIVGSMEIPVRHQKHFSLTHRIGEPPDVWQQLLGSGDIQVASGQHEIPLHIYFPEYEVLRNHRSPSVEKPNIIISPPTTRRIPTSPQRRFTHTKPSRMICDLSEI